MRFLVLGAGAIGSVIGGFLGRAGHDVTLVGRREHMAAIASRGLRITGIWGEYEIGGLRTSESVSQVAGEQFDAVLLSVKSYDTEKAMEQLVAARLGGQPPVVSLQNGLGNVETIARFVSAGRTIGGRVIFGVEAEPGHCRVTVYAEEVMLGTIERNERLQATARMLARTLSDAGIPALPTDRIHAYLWGKILYNCSLNPTATLLGSHYGELIEHEETRQILRDVVREVHAVAAARSVDMLVPTAEAYVPILFGRLVPATYNHYPSMLHDIRSGRQTEIEAMNGAIVRYGRESGVATPINELLTLLIRTLERRSKSVGSSSG
ncbi:ketopantoate reductase family protein [Candidatus Sumerlaeota bacterium]|nr:ketopantoate reductase family protein [Candidatus Sumerlaeota bacterium]